MLTLLRPGANPNTYTIYLNLKDIPWNMASPVPLFRLHNKEEMGKTQYIKNVLSYSNLI